MKYITQIRYDFEIHIDASDLVLNRLYDVSFTSNNVQFVHMQYRAEGLYYGATLVYDNTNWIADAYRTIVINKGQYVLDEFDTFIQSNIIHSEIDKIIDSSLTLYRMTCEKNRVDKTSYLTNQRKINGNFRDSQSVVNLEITIQHNGYPRYNYIYCNVLDRYYFITNITFITDNLWMLTCHCDVLMTYKEDILNTNAKIERCEYDLYANRELEDGMCDLENKNLIEYIENNLSVAEKTKADAIRCDIQSGEYVLICNS